jgi:tetratricopeptide (TPR) repeat protein
MAIQAICAVVAAMLALVSVGVARAGAQTSADDAIHRAQYKLRRSAGDARAYHRLGEAYILKARETGDLGYLDRAAQALQRAVAIDPADAGATRHLAYLSSTRHDFHAAATHAARAVALDPRDGDAWGVLGDAWLELGRYERAADAYDAMMRIKGDLSSFARRAALKNLRGDADGAIEDLRLAVASGRAERQPRESVAWAEWQLGAEHFAIGQLDAAEAQYHAALATFPGYHRALAGLAEVRAAQRRPDEAIDLYERAIAATPVPEHAAALGDLHASMGRAAEAEKAYELVEHIGRLSAANQAIHNRQLAAFYADHGRQLDRALALARAELEVRQDIYGHDVLAWALYKLGRWQEAIAPMDEALKLGTRDAKLFFHAGMIHRAAGNTTLARDYLARALATNPHFHVLHAPAAARVLAEAVGPRVPAALAEAVGPRVLAVLAEAVEPRVLATSAELAPGRAADAVAP